MEPEENKNTKPDNSLKAVGSFIWDLIKILVVALIIIVPFRMFVAEPFVVSGSSMLPDYHNKDYLIVDRISYQSHDPARGDVVVLKYPKDTSQFFIKRIIGLPGETVTCQNGKVEIEETNGENLELNEPYLAPGTPTTNCHPKQVLGSDEYFVLGDNRLFSSDSRVWGILPKDDIVGKVWLRVFPLNYFGTFPHYTY